MSKLYICLRYALALVLLLAVPHKLFDPATFAHSVASYAILPDILIQPAALIIPWLEIVLAVLLIFQVWMGPTLTLINLLFLVFLAALAFAQSKGLNIDCGCFGVGGDASPMVWYLARDMVFLGMSLLAAALYRLQSRTSC